MLGVSGIMTRNSLRICAFASLTVIVGGCAGDSDQYPSVAIRDVERAQGQFEPSAPIEPAELPIRSMAPSESVEEILDRAGGAYQSFLAREGDVRRLVAQARGTSSESDARGKAVVAIADLTSLRSELEIALADLDLLVTERSNRLVDYKEADIAHALVLDLATEQDRTLSALWNSLGQ